eukprot:SAG11_NODE_5367_length_1581_cov_1.302969_3_plen_145_part_00
MRHHSLPLAAMNAATNSGQPAQFAAGSQLFASEGYPSQDTRYWRARPRPCIASICCTTYSSFAVWVSISTCLKLQFTAIRCLQTLAAEALPRPIAFRLQRLSLLLWALQLAPLGLPADCGVNCFTFDTPPSQYAMYLPQHSTKK